MRAYAYARYSSDNQRTESIEAQINDIRVYAENNNIEIIKTYVDEAESARTDDRPQFQQMIQDIESIDVVLVHKLDRFARNRYDAALYRKKIKDKGSRLISVLEPLDDSPESIILESVLDGMAEYYSRNLAREVMKGMKMNAKKGISNGGIAPIGYRFENKVLVVDEPKAQKVREAFNLVIEGLPYEAITEKTGIKSVKKIIRNTKYKGIGMFNKYSSEPIHYSTPIIVDESIWEEANRVVNNKWKPKNNAKKKYLLTGLMYCGHDGDKYIGIGFKGNAQYYYYGCKSCKSIIRKEWIEHTVVEKIRELLTDEALASLIPLIMAKIEKPKSYKEEIARLDKKIERLIDALEEGEDVKDRLKARREERKELLAKENTPKVGPVEVMASLINYRNNIEQRKTIEAFIEKVEVFNDEVVIYFKFSDKGVIASPVVLPSLILKRSHRIRFYC